METRTFPEIKSDNYSNKSSIRSYSNEFEFPYELRTSDRSYR